MSLGEKAEALQIARQAVLEDDLDANSWRQVMEVFVRNREFGEGVRAAEAVLTTRPGDRVALPVLAACHLGLENFEQALLAAQQAGHQESDPELAAMHWNLAADCLARLSRWEEAEDLYRKQGVSQPRLGRQLAEAALVRRDPDTALRIVASALDEAPGDARLMGLKAAAYHQREDWDEYRQALDEAAACVAEADFVPALMKAYRQLPGDGACQCLRLWKLARERWPDSWLGPEGDAVVELLMQRQDWAAATEALGLKLAEEPESATARGQLAMCLFNQDRFAECVQMGTEQLVAHPEDHVAVLIRTSALRALNRQAEALDVASPIYQGVSLFWGWLQVAEAACLLDRQELAFEPFQRALDLWPDPPGDEPRMATLAERARRLGLLAGLVERLGAGNNQAPASAAACQFAAAASEDRQERIRLLTAGAGLDAKRPMLAVELAGHLLASGEVDRATFVAREALPHCELAPAAKLGLAEILRLSGAPAEETLPLARAAAVGLEKSGKDPSRAHQVEAEILLASGRDEDALAPAVRAARLSAHPAHFMTVGRVFSKLGEHDEALRWVAKGLAHEPKHAGLQVARAALLGVLGKREEALKVAQLVG